MSLQRVFLLFVKDRSYAELTFTKDDSLYRTHVRLWLWRSCLAVSGHISGLYSRCRRRPSRSRLQAPGTTSRLLRQSSFPCNKR